MKMKSFAQLADVFNDTQVKEKRSSPVAEELQEPVRGRYSIDQMNKSRDAAIIQIKKYLDNIDYWSKNLPMLQHGDQDFVAISYLTNYLGQPSKMNLVIPSYLFTSESGVKCFKSVKNAEVDKTLANYFSIEQGLVKFGMDMLFGEMKKSFAEKYQQVNISAEKVA